MFCPKCKKNEAKASMTYPEILVCYCGGEKLNEVGSSKTSPLFHGIDCAIQKKGRFDKTITITQDQITKHLDRVAKEREGRFSHFFNTQIRSQGSDDSEKISLY